MKFEVGQTVFIPGRSCRETGFTTTIEKIGRRWMQTSSKGIRIDANTGKADLAGFGTAEVYESEKAYRAIVDDATNRRKLNGKILGRLSDADIATLGKIWELLENQP